MPNIKDITQLATTAKATAQSLSQTMGIGKNGTQPVPLAGPSLLNNTSVAAAELFTTALGSTQPSATALAQLSKNISAGIDAPNVIGAVGGQFSNGDLIGQATSVFSSEASISALSQGSFSDTAMADLANSAFAVGAAELDLPGLEGVGALGDYVMAPSETGGIPKDWIFVIAPQNISWDKKGDTNTVNTYGSNNPYVVYSTTSMRTLRLSDVLVEGFSVGKEVESHIEKLEAMMRMVMNTEKGYVSPYCWDLRAGEKTYGKFIITEIQIKEEMRNAKGRADRARVDITLQQVPDFQISDGRDLATKADLASGKSLQSEQEKAKESSTSAAKKKAKSDPGTPAKAPSTPLSPDNKPNPLNVDDAPKPVNVDEISRSLGQITPVRGSVALTIQ